MIENKALFNRMAAEWIKEFMYGQKTFKTIDVLNAMPLKHLGIDWSVAKVGDSQRDYLFHLVEELIPIYAGRYGYAQDAHGFWRQANYKPTPEFEVNGEGGNFTVNPDENYDDCNGVLQTPDQNVWISTGGETEAIDLALGVPFEDYAKKLCALLGQDPDVTVVSDLSTKTINICVHGCSKPTAFRTFFPGKMNLKGVGEITILVNGHKKTYKTFSDEGIIRTMFANNPIVQEVKVTRTPDGTIDQMFVIFKNTTVQVHNDNWGSPWCVTTVSAESLAHDVMPKAKDTNTVVLWTTFSEGPTRI